MNRDFLAYGRYHLHNVIGFTQNCMSYFEWSNFLSNGFMNYNIFIAINL